MAEANEAALADEPARRLARLLLEKTGEAPPVNVEGLLRRYADVEVVDLPVRGDAVVQQTPGKRTKVYLASAADYEPRLRFTMAHEIGHLVIPWQPGTLVCHTGVTYKFDDALVEIYEREANVFASELLLPTPWVRSRFPDSGVDPAAQVRHLADFAGVSGPVAVLALGRHCGPGTLLLLVENWSGRVRYHGCALNAGLHVPSIWNDEIATQVRATGGQVSVADWGSQAIYAVKFEPARVVRPIRTSKQIRAHILSSLAMTEPEQRTLVLRIAGIIGAANSGSRESTVEVLRSVLAASFVGREEAFSGFVAHTDFAEFLDAVATELRDPKRTSRR